MTHDPLPEAPVWVTREMECAICDHRWVAVFPRFTPLLECPRCGYAKNQTSRTVEE